MYRIKTQENYSRSMLYQEIAFILLLLSAYLFNIQVLILSLFGIACLMVLFSNNKHSIEYLAYFTSFARLFVYQGRYMFFVMVALFLLRFLWNRRISRATFVFYVLIVVYGFICSNQENSIKFGNLIGMILLFAVPVIAEVSTEINYRILMQHYIFGFVLSTIIGFFAEEIPAMARLFSYDLMWTEDYQELTRFCGLAFDSNFYALGNYVILAYLLFSFEKLDKFKLILIAFLVISGLQTVSKSYFLILGILFICYLIKILPNAKKLFAFISIACVGGGLFLFISSKLGYNVIDLVTNRFVVNGSFSDNATGRAEIWEMYWEMFKNSSPKELMLGYGINGLAERAAHNTFIEFLFHYGVIGSALWMIYFIYCRRLYTRKTYGYIIKTNMPGLCFVLGICFLSAYTYEAFWMGIVISFLTFKNINRARF